MSRPALFRRGRLHRDFLLLLALSLCAALFAAGIPALVARSQTSSLQQALAGASPADRSMIANLSYRSFARSSGPTPAAQSLDAILKAYAAEIPAAAGAEQSQAWDGASLHESLDLDAQGSSAQLELEYRSDPSAHVRLLAGAMPAEAVRTSAAAPLVFDVALSTATAKLYGAQVGSLIPLAGYRLRVTGVFEPRDAAAEFWYYDRDLQSPTFIQKPGGDYWDTAALVGPDELPVLASLHNTQGESNSLNLVLCVPLDTGGYRSQNAGPLLTSLTDFDSGAVAANLPLESIASPVTELTSFQQERTSIDAILALVLSGVAVVGAVTMLLCAQLVVSRRRRYFTLLRARGQSGRQLAGHVCLSLGLPNLVAVVLAAGLVRIAFPADWTPLGTTLCTAVGTVALLGPAVLAVLDLRGRSDTHADRRDLVRWARTPRRRVLELLVLVVAAAAVAQLRRQGLGGEQQGSNVLGSLTPILVAGLATIIAARCYPLLLRPAARVADKRGGPISFLGLAGAARSAFPLAAPAFVITLTLALAALGGMMNEAVERGRVEQSWQSLGADAVVTLPTGTGWAAATRADSAIEAVPGVSHATAVAGQADYTANTDVVVVDPNSYAAVSADTPWPFGPAALPGSGSSSSGVAPVLVEPGSGQAVGTLIEIHPAYAPQIEAKVVGYVAQTPIAPDGAASGTGLVLMPSWALGANANEWPATEILVSGPGIDESGMNAALKRSLPAGTTVAYRADLLARYSHAPLANLAELGYLAGLLVAGGFGICAILLSFSLTAPARGRRLTLLGALGLTARQARGIALAETVPLITATLLAGLLAAAALPAVFGDSLNLSVFTGVSGPSSLRFDPGIPLLAALAAAALTALGVAVQTTAAGRRNTGAELRAVQDADA